MNEINRASSKSLASSWWNGFENLLRKENSEWWSTSRWIKHAILWLVICNGFSILLMFALPFVMQAGQGDPTIPALDPLDAGINLFAIASMTGISIGIALIAHGQVIDEKLFGTAEWVLSKPIARSAFLLAKIASSLIATLTLMVAIPGVFMYALLSIRAGAPFPVRPFLIIEGIICLNALFYLSITFLLGTISANRALVIGGVVTSVFGGQFLLQFFPILTQFTPWGLMIWIRMVASGAVVSTDILLPVTITVLLIAGSILLAIRVFDQTEI